jgi:hypothetical protein
LLTEAAVSATRSGSASEGDHGFAGEGAGVVAGVRGREFVERDPVGDVDVELAGGCRCMSSVDSCGGPGGSTLL